MTSAVPLERLAESLYERHVPLLVNIAMHRFGIPQTEALGVVHDTFVSFMRVGSNVRQPEKWLVAAVCNSSRQYLRDHIAPAAIEGDAVDLSTDVDAVLRCLDAARLLTRLSPVCRDVLEAHYLRGHSAREIGEFRETSTRYAEREIHRCLENARRLLKGGNDAP